MQFVRVLSCVLHVIAQAASPEQSEPPEYSPVDGSLPVPAEVNSGIGLKQTEKRLKLYFRFRSLPEDFRAVVREVAGLADDSREFRGDSLRRQNEIDAACGDSASRHTIELCRCRVLCEYDASLLCNRLHPQCSVGARPRKDDANRCAPFRLSATERRNRSTAVPAVCLGLSASPRPEIVMPVLGGITYTWLGERTVPYSSWVTIIPVSLESS